MIKGALHAPKGTTGRCRRRGLRGSAAITTTTPLARKRGGELRAQFVDLGETTLRITPIRQPLFELARGFRLHAVTLVGELVRSAEDDTRAVFQGCFRKGSRIFLGANDAGLISGGGRFHPFTIGRKRLFGQILGRF